MLLMRQNANAGKHAHARNTCARMRSDKADDTLRRDTSWHAWMGSMGSHNLTGLGLTRHRPKHYWPAVS